MRGQTKKHLKSRSINTVAKVNWLEWIGSSMDLLNSDWKCHTEVKESGGGADGWWRSAFWWLTLSWRLFVALGYTPTRRKRWSFVHRPGEWLMTALSSLLTVNAQINALSLAPINSLVLWLEVSGLKKDGLILSLRTQQPQNPDVVKEGGGWTWGRGGEIG